jgi:hypothetical protein
MRDWSLKNQRNGDLRVRIPKTLPQGLIDEFLEPDLFCGLSALHVAFEGFRREHFGTRDFVLGSFSSIKKREIIRSLRDRRTFLGSSSTCQLFLTSASY